MGKLKSSRLWRSNPSMNILGADGSLLITPTIMTDLGVYECKVKVKIKVVNFCWSFTIPLFE